MKLFRQVRRFAGLLVLAAGSLSGSAARADVTLWYNGDADGRDALINGTNLFVGKELVYDDFVVPAGQTWTISSVFSNNEMNFTGVHQATWEIRTGILAGNGGTLVASGRWSGDTNHQRNADRHPGLGVGRTKARSRRPFPRSRSRPASRISWPSRPTVPTRSRASNSFTSETTSGAGAIGTPPGNNGNSFINNNLAPPFSFNFTPTSDNSVEGAGTWDYSLGVVGTSASIAIPEPSTLSLFTLTGLAGLAVARYRRRNKLQG